MGKKNLAVEIVERWEVGHVICSERWLGGDLG